ISRYQTAVLHRSDSLLVLTTALLPVIVADLEAIDAFLAAGRPEDRTLEVADASVREGLVRGSIQVEEGDWLASLEMRGSGWRGRLREGVPAPTLDAGFGLSNPVFVSAEPEPTDESLLASMLPG